MLKLPEPKLENFAENYSGAITSKFLAYLRGGKKTFVFNGPSGCGKSFLAESLASSNSLNLKRVNLYAINEDETDGNVSDRIVSLVNNAANSRSIFDNKGKVVYVEDAEKIISVDPSIFQRLESGSSILIIESESGDVFREKNKRFLDRFQMIRFYRLKPEIVKLYLAKVRAMSAIGVSDSLLDRIAESSKGNIMSAVTDLNTLAITGGTAMLSRRNTDNSVFERLEAVFSGAPSDIDMHFSSEYEAKLFEIWLAEKAPTFLTGRKLNFVFDRLSFSDVLLNKIRAQRWGLLKYVQNELSYGVASVCDKGSFRMNYSAPRWNLYYKF
jgi:GTPase SAR1 family protein